MFTYISGAGLTRQSYVLQVSGLRLYTSSTFRLVTKKKRYYIYIYIYMYTCFFKCWLTMCSCCLGVGSPPLQLLHFPAGHIYTNIYTHTYIYTCLYVYVHISGSQYSSVLQVAGLRLYTSSTFRLVNGPLIYIFIHTHTYIYIYIYIFKLIHTYVRPALFFCSLGVGSPPLHIVLFPAGQQYIYIYTYKCSYVYMHMLGSQ